jgi:DNA-binding XRE family transcriptional regulator
MTKRQQAATRPATRAQQHTAAPKRGRPQVQISLREAREKRSLSLTELATLAGVDRMTVYRVEQGKNAPYPRTRRLLAQALRMEPGQIAWPGMA